MPHRPVVAIAPVGDVETGLAAIVGPAVATAFDVEVASAPPLTAPAAAFDRARGQWLSTAFLDVLARAKQQDWERPLGVTGTDLYVPQLNFVFGQADPRRGVPLSPSTACAPPARRSSPGAPPPRPCTSSATPTASATATAATA